MVLYLDVLVDVVHTRDIWGTVRDHQIGFEALEMTKDLIYCSHGGDIALAKGTSRESNFYK